MIRIAKNWERSFLGVKNRRRHSAAATPRFWVPFISLYPHIPISLFFQYVLVALDVFIVFLLFSISRKAKFLLLKNQEINDFPWGVLLKFGDVQFWGYKTAGGSPQDSHLGFKSHLYHCSYLYPY